MSTRWTPGATVTFPRANVLEVIRDVLKRIIYHNISKINKIQYGQYQIPENKHKEYFEKMDLTGMLKVQNLESKDNVMEYIGSIKYLYLFYKRI